MSSEAARLAMRGVESLWTAAFRWLGRGRPSVARWSSPGGSRVLCVAPHPDDETAGCGGTLARHAAAGDEVRIVFVTDGRRSRAFGLPPDEMARRRRLEAEAAARALGASISWLGLPEGEWSGREATAALEAELRAFLPDLAYAPSRLDFHPEHVKVAQALGAVLSRGARDGSRVRVYPVQVPLTSLLVDLVCDVTSVEALPRAISAYATQAGTLASALRPRRYAAAFHRCGSLAEGFWEMTPRAYAALHAGPADPGGAARMRGLRRRPFTDPLAFLVGRRERRRALRDAA